MNDINLFSTEGSIYLKKIRMKSGVLKDDDCDGYLIDADEKMARRIIESLKGSGKKIGVVGGNDAFNRRVIETLKVDYLVSPEGGLKKDTLKQRDSGINHVVAKLAKSKGILIVVDMGEIKKLSSKDDSGEPKGKGLALRLGRIIQNVKICRKAGCGIKIASLGSKESDVFGELERKAFGESLGMSSKQSADTVRF